MVFPHASGSAEETLLMRVANLHKELRYEERHTERYARLSAAIRELSAAYCTAVDAQRSVAATGRRSTTARPPRETTSIC
jgi:hypothetical protein